MLRSSIKVPAGERAFHGCDSGVRKRHVPRANIHSAMDGRTKMPNYLVGGILDSDVFVITSCDDERNASFVASGWNRPRQ